MKIIKKYLRVIIVIAIVIVILGIYKVIPRYHNPYTKGNISKQIGLIMGNKDRTKDLVDDIIIEDNRILLSFENMKRFIDENIQDDEKYNQIITNSIYSTKIIDYTNKKMREYTSNNWEDIYVKEESNKRYFDIKQLQEVYGIDVKYVEKTNLVVIDKDIYTNKIGSIKKNTNLMYLPSSISAKIDKLVSESKVYILREDKSYYKVVDDLGRFGYVKQKDVENVQDTQAYTTKKYDGKINLVWDYMYYTSPDRSAESKIEGLNIISPTWLELVDNTGKILDKTDQNYINWTKNVGYDIWVMFSNNSKIDTTHTILNDSKLREKVITQVLKICEENNFNGINVDFENIYKEDKDMYSQFVRELAIAFRNKGMFVSVDVTVPDGGDTWSLCFDRNKLADAVDYVILMAYDQTQASSQKPNSVSAYNWVDANLEKMTTNEGVSSDKLILGLPFYTRIWKTDLSSNKVTSATLDMKDTNSYIAGNNVTTTWLDAEKQNYADYVLGNTTKYQIWVEDIKSIEEKLKLYEKYNLAGVAAWEKDREDQAVWKLINSYLNK